MARIVGRRQQNIPVALMISLRMKVLHTVGRKEAEYFAQCGFDGCDACLAGQHYYKIWLADMF